MTHSAGPQGWHVPNTSYPWLRPVGQTGLTVSAICAGGSHLASMPENFGYEVSEARAVDLVEAILESPIRFLDTSNGYSEGESERRIGLAIKRHGGLPPDFLVATKVDAIGSDYSGRRVEQSIRESRERLGVERLPLVYLHDPEFHDFEYMTAPGGAVDTLVRLRDDGEIGAIGLAGGQVQVMERYLNLSVFQVLLVHNRWTLVDRSAEKIIALATNAGMGVMNAAIYGGGILANPRGGSTSYGYRPAHPETLAAISAMAEVCQRWGTDLATAALQASTRDELITSTIVGFSKLSRLEGLLTAAELVLPEPFWTEMTDLMPPPSTWLDAG